MVGKNIISMPVQTLVVKDGNLISGNLNYIDYDYDNFHVLLDRQYNLEIQHPITFFTFKLYIILYWNWNWYILGIPTITCDKQFHFDSRFKMNILYDSYDSHGNLLQYHKNNDINVSYIWVTITLTRLQKLKMQLQMKYISTVSKIIQMKTTLLSRIVEIIRTRWQ